MKRVRVACHVHSEWSYDGRWTLTDIAREFERRRYAAVLMAEHDRGFDERRWQDYREACTEASTDSVLVVPGIEYGDPADAIHVAVWGDLPFLGEANEIGWLLGRVRALGGVAVLAHPGRRNAWRMVEPGWLDFLAGVEVWNRKYDGWAPGGEGTAMLRGRAPSPLPFAGLDFHTDRQLSPLAMLIDVNAPLSEASIVEAIAAGRCRPRVAGIPAGAFLAWPGRGLAGSAERLRRYLARARRRPAIRQLEARIRRRSPD